MKKILLTLLTLVLATALMIPAATPAAAVSAPITLTADYTLTSDMTFDDTGFIIAADGITLDLGGYTINGSYPPIPLVGPLSAGVQLNGRTGVTVKNGVVRGFNEGVSLLSSNSNVITGMITSGNTLRGLGIWGSSNNVIEGVVTSGNAYDGITVGYSSNNIIKELVSSDNGFWGIEITTDSDNNQVSDSTFASNGRTQPAGGIVIADSDGNIVERCTLTSNRSNGVLIVGRLSPVDGHVPASHNIIRDSTVIDSGTGIRVSIADNNQINNTVISNNALGVSILNSAGNSLTGSDINNSTSSSNVVFNNADGNTVIGNTVSNDQLFNGILLLNGSDSNAILNNTVSSNLPSAINPFPAGILLSNGTQSDGTAGAPNVNNVIQHNTVTGGATGIGLTTSSNNQVLNNSVSDVGSASLGKGVGLSLRLGANNNVVRNNTVSNSGIRGIVVSDSNANTVYNNNFINNPSPQASVGGTSVGNIFNLPIPAGGGNYWSDWNSPDANYDGFVDADYVFSSGRDNLPWALQNGWRANFVTGGGNIKVDKDVTWTFSGTVSVLPEGGLVGNAEIVDHANNVTYSLNQFVVLVFSGPQAESPQANRDTARFRGKGTRSSDGAGVEVVIIMQDNGEPGAGVDKIAAEVARVNGLANVIPLIGRVYVPETGLPLPLPPPELVVISGGNFQIHGIEQ